MRKNIQKNLKKKGNEGILSQQVSKHCINLQQQKQNGSRGKKWANRSMVQSREFQEVYSGIYLLQIECTDCTLKSLSIFAHLTIQKGTLRLLFHAKQSLLTLHIFPTSFSDTRSRKLCFQRAHLLRSGPSDNYPFCHKTQPDLRNDTRGRAHGGFSKLCPACLIT